MKNIKKMKFAPLIGLLLLGSPAIAETNQELNNNLCQSNVLHYAASINDIDYFTDLLNMNSFTLTDLNHLCDTVYHIAIQNNSIDILNALFEYIPIQDAVFNKSGENLIQYAIKHNQPEILIFLINSGLDPHIKSQNNLSGVDYQGKYGNEVTDKIISDYDRTQLLVHVSSEKNHYQALLAELELSLKEKESKIINQNEIGIDDKELLYSQQNLRQEVLLLRNQITFLTNVINQKNLEIDKLRSLLEESNISEENINEKEFSLEKNDDFEFETLDNKDLLKNIDSDILDGQMDRIFEIFSRPIYKIQEKE